MSRTRHQALRLGTTGFKSVTAIALVLAGTFAVSACSSSAKPTKPRPIDTLQKAMSEFVGHTDGPPGIVVAIGHGSRVNLLTAGVADTTTKAKPMAADHMRMASVAKAFSGAAALSLVAKGTLTLNDTIGKWLPKLPAAWAPVTLRNLLGHTSGISDFSKSPAFAAALTASLQKPAAPEKLLSFADKALVFTPGSKYEYSNSDNIAAALMVQAATHRSYESVLSTNVYQPLDLTQTSLPSGSAIASPTLRGYAIDPPAAPEDITTQFAAGWTWASGGIVSTPTDAVHFVEGYAHGATTDKATQAAQFTFRAGSSEPPGPGVNAAGLAIFRYQTSCGTVYGHTGNTAGYTQFIASTPNGQRAVAVSINAQIIPGNNAKRFAELHHIYELAVCTAV